MSAESRLISFLLISVSRGISHELRLSRSSMQKLRPWFNMDHGGVEKDGIGAGHRWSEGDIAATKDAYATHEAAERGHAATDK